MAERTLLFLDFDGVICDSIQECLLSSWIAYYHFHLGRQPDRVPLDLKTAFATLRPFIRDSQDYLLIQQLQAAGRTIRTQQEFDAAIAETGTKQMGEYKDLFYKSRNELIAGDFAFWCRLNRLYPHMVRWMAAFGRHPAFYILSTKKPQYIREILRYHQLPVNEDHILYNGEQTKYALIRPFLEPGTRAVFIDDQIDHLRKAADERIESRLPAWGYIKPGWLKEEIPVIGPEEMGSVFSRLREQP